ncbi:MAG TPA: chromosomal replication initiator protein DnaA [Nocardioidaceae bacterium]|nr:chromosomal replication initiator protein DnaA [Nocardioidaceae bacterium]
MLIEDLPPNQRAWLAASRPVTIHENTAIVAVADEFTRNQLEGRLRTRLEDSLTESLGQHVRIAVTVDPGLGDGFDPTPAARYTREETAEGVANEPAPAFRHGYESDGQRHGGHDTAPSINPQIHLSTNPLDVPTPLPPSAPRSTAAAGNVLETRLNPKYIFESFVIGSSNRFAHAAAVAVAEAPGKAYNPLLIYGDSGLGKTHLLHAIGHYVRSLFNGARVRYVSTEEFTNEFINAIRDDKAATFQRRYRDVDVLLIDDIQFLEGKIQTQEEFFHTFNTLHNANKQIVITSDRAPKRLVALEDRLRNRFEWGLITDVQPPDLETRIAILRKKAALERMTAPPDVLEFIASKIQTNIRELEGALIRVTAFASLNRQPVDLTLAEIVLKDLIPEGGEPEITAALIIAQTAAYFGLSIDDLCGSSRSRVLVTARQIAMYLCRELTDLSLPKIGQQFGGRDHTTVMHADKKIRQLLAERRSVYNQVTELTNRIKQQARQP